MMKKLTLILLSGMMIFSVEPVYAAQKLPKTLSSKEIHQAINKTKSYQGKEHVYVAINGQVKVANNGKGDTYYYATNDRMSIKSTPKQAIVTGVQKGPATLIENNYKKGKKKITINKQYGSNDQLEFNYTSLQLNLNDTVKIQTNKEATLTNTHDNIVRLNKDHTITCLKPGTSVITATHKEIVGDSDDQKEVIQKATLKIKVVGHIIKQYKHKVTVSDPQIGDLVYCVPNNFEIVKLPIKGISTASRKRIYVDTLGVNEKAKYPAVQSLQGKIITKASDQGKLRIRYHVNTTCKIYVDGLVLKRHITISKLKFDSLKDTILLPNQKAHFMMKGMSGQTKVTINPLSNTSVNMNKENVVTAHKLGKMTINIAGDGITYKRQYWCVNKKTYKLIHDAYAIAQTKPKFSLSRQGKTTDCSTFMWRVYKQNGINFGKNSAPVASDIAKYCQSHGKLMKAPKTIDSLRPGDLMFISSHKNGRFKNITHVEMYISSGTDLGARGPSTTPYNKKAYGSIVEGDALTDNLIAVGRLKL